MSLNALHLTCEGNGILPINEKPVRIKQLTCIADSWCKIYIREQTGNIAQQVLDRLAGRKKLTLAIFDMPAGEHISWNGGLTLTTPHEVEVKFNKGSGFFQILLEIDNA